MQYHWPYLRQGKVKSLKFFFKRDYRINSFVNIGVDKGIENVQLDVLQQFFSKLYGHERNIKNTLR